MTNLPHQPLDFRTDHLIATRIGLPRIHYQSNDDVASFFTKVDQNLRESRGVEAVAPRLSLATSREMISGPASPSRARASNPGEYEQASLRYVDSGFLPLMQIPILDGRNFTDADDTRTQRVTMVSESLAHK